VARKNPSRDPSRNRGLTGSAHTGSIMSWFLTRLKVDSPVIHAAGDVHTIFFSAPFFRARSRTGQTDRQTDGRARHVMVLIGRPDNYLLITYECNTRATMSFRWHPKPSLTLFFRRHCRVIGKTTAADNCATLNNHQQNVTRFGGFLWSLEWDVDCVQTVWCFIETRYFLSLFLSNSSPISLSFPLF